MIREHSAEEKTARTLIDAINYAISRGQGTVDHALKEMLRLACLNLENIDRIQCKHPPGEYVFEVYTRYKEGQSQAYRIVANSAAAACEIALRGSPPRSRVMDVREVVVLEPKASTCTAAGDTTSTEDAKP